MSDVYLQYVHFSNVRFKHVRIHNSNCSHAIFDGAQFGDANTEGFIAGLDATIFRHASFRNADLSRNSFHGMSGTQNRSKRAHMMDPGYGGADMTGAIFESANCSRCIFSRCMLTGARRK